MRPIAVLLSLLALLACGGGDDEPERVSDGGDLATYEVESSGFSIGVPSDWTVLSADEAFDEEMLDSIRENDPELAPIVDQMERRTRRSSSSPCRQRPTRPGEPQRLVIEDVPEGTTRDDYFAQSAGQVEGLAESDVETERVDLPAGEALLRYEHSLGGAARSRRFSTSSSRRDRVHADLHGARSPPPHTAEFERSAQSFRID